MPALLVVIFPDRRQFYEALQPRLGNYQWDYPTERLTEFFKREQIAFVDLLPKFQRICALHR